MRVADVFIADRRELGGTIAEGIETEEWVRSEPCKDVSVDSAPEARQACAGHPWLGDGGTHRRNGYSPVSSSTFAAGALVLTDSIPFLAADLLV